MSNDYDFLIYWKKKRKIGKQKYIINNFVENTLPSIITFIVLTIVIDYLILKKDFIFKKLLITIIEDSIGISLAQFVVWNRKWNLNEKRFFND